MAKMTKEIRKVIFQSAINKLYGERLIAEKEEFEKKSEAIVLNMVKRIAKENGVDYGKLITSYKPYIETGNFFYYRTDSGFFDNELDQIFYNENFGVLDYADAKFETVQKYKTHHSNGIRVEKPLPRTSKELGYANIGC
jgi:hypothetical protein